jgi:general transcription factor 3C polypeptide 3 (transcription factor C subunit 4)
VIDSRGRNRNQREQDDASQAGGAAHTSLFEETPRSKGRTPSRKVRKLTPAQLRELEEQKEKDVLRGYKRVKELWPKMLDKTHTEPDRSREEAEREWMFEAEKLVEMFRETRMLFLSTRVRLLSSILSEQLKKLTDIYFRTIRFAGCYLASLPLSGMIRQIKTVWLLVWNSWVSRHGQCFY